MGGAKREGRREWGSEGGVGGARGRVSGARGWSGIVILLHRPGFEPRPSHYFIITLSEHVLFILIVVSYVS